MIREFEITDAQQLELFELRHQPIQPPRANHDGEQVYASIWEATMAPSVDGAFGDDVIPIRDVLADLRKLPTQRHAAVLASVACWLGTNIGRAMLARAERIAAGQDRSIPPDDAYLVAWTLENSRLAHVNNGVRIIEYLLATPDLIQPRPRIVESGLMALPEISAEDLEVVDHMMLWLGQPDGQRYLQRCSAKLAGIEQERRLLREADYIRFMNGEKRP